VLVGVLPPLLAAGLRAATAGALLLGWAFLRGTPLPSRREWRHGAVAGGLMFLIGHGALFSASQHTASGFAAVLAATIPLWVAGFTILSRRTLTRRTLTGLALAIAGIVWLNLPAMHAGIAVRDSVLLLTCAAAWGLAMVWYRGARRPASTVLASALPLLTGGLLLLVASAAVEHPSTIPPGAFSLPIIGCFAYVVLFGSILGFSAFAWLNGVVSPTAVSSYAFVNPVVALLLGWTLGREAFVPATLLPTALVIAAVVLVLNGEQPTAAARPPLVRPVAAR
jgi:drug/metabolite transporter (DMT)-like permease